MEKAHKFYTLIFTVYLPEGENVDFLDLPRRMPSAISLIEWPSRLTSNMLPKSFLQATIAFPTHLSPLEEGDDGEDGSPRVVHLAATGEAWPAKLGRILRACGRPGWEAGRAMDPRPP
eukprot:CAMPEP_0177630498 /NCGR_PEP_ID=MMETSP0447-20121125/1241_1 /TAXON_ID=0 /ORGANISM="Stygamoeba regulata, Strain BSH-02190019" /LENGTH=117 /DNA_ID=CAMNT_0019131905 /DNA_START=183 /DNA_END=536 /DNA_ORIENTATION=-